MQKKAETSAPVSRRLALRGGGGFANKPLWYFLCSAPNHTAASQPTGYHMTPPFCPFGPSGPLGPQASVTPAQTAYPRCYQVAKHYPVVNSAPRAKPDSDMQTHGVYLCTQVLNNRCCLLCPAGGTDYKYCEYCECCEYCVLFGAPMSSYHHCGLSLPRAKPDCDKQTIGVLHDLPRRSPSGRRRAPPSCPFGLSGPPGPQASVTPTQHAYPRCHQN